MSRPFEPRQWLTLPCVAFSTKVASQQDLLMWQLLWTDGDLTTEAGAPPADDMLLMGLNATERKVVHQLAGLIGLYSESRLLDDGQEGDDTKPDKVLPPQALALRPPWSLRCRAGSCAAPFSLSQVLKSSVMGSRCSKGCRSSETGSSREKAVSAQL
ncbi:unnamed protein product [Symbiodinium sp. CCMP2592]|nr:unnamed protein product [Symbiodinium sp. CCMP2592]